MKRDTRPTTVELPPTEENFAKRWSRLKQESLEDPSESQSALPQQSEGDSEKVLTDEDMPDIETLTPDSDYAGFFSPEVSESLRRLALRKLFQGAEFNIRDGLDDYDQDFTSFTKLAGVITADMKHRLALELERAAERDDTEPVQEINVGATGGSPEHGHDRAREPDESANLGATGGSPAQDHDRTPDPDKSTNVRATGGSPLCHTPHTMSEESNR